MFFASLEQMRRYGVENADIRAAVAFARSLSEADATVFPGLPCTLQALRDGGMSRCASYIMMPDGRESYLVYVHLLASRLELQAADLQSEHAHHANLDDMASRALIVDAIAVHEVRHRFQQYLGPSLMQWRIDDLDAADAGIMSTIVATIAPEQRTEREIDARIVEFLYVKDRLGPGIATADAVRREPRRKTPSP